jgi:uncharacterized membrane protein
MTILDASVEMEVEAVAAYQRWLQIEQFPYFAEVIESVEWVEPGRRSHWHVTIAGRHERWDAATVEVIPGKRIAWRSVTGSVNSGVVTFHDTREGECVAVLHLEYTPRGVIENLADELGVVERLVGRFLDQFKEFVENVERGPSTT